MWELKKVGYACMKVDMQIMGKQRPKFGNGRTYTPSKTMQAEKIIWERFREAYGDRYANFTGPVKIRITYARELAKSNPKKWFGRFDTHKPDIDNVAKLVTDALNGVAYRDDSQIVKLIAEKDRRNAHGDGNYLIVQVFYYEEVFVKEKNTAIPYELLYV